MGENEKLDGLKLIISGSDKKKKVDWCLYNKSKTQPDKEMNTSYCESSADLFLLLHKIFDQHGSLDLVDVTWSEVDPRKTELCLKVAMWLFEIWQVSVTFRLPPKEESGTPSKEGPKVPELQFSYCQYRIYGPDFIKWCWEDLYKMGGARGTEDAQGPGGEGQKT